MEIEVTPAGHFAHAYGTVPLYLRGDTIYVGAAIMLKRNPDVATQMVRCEGKPVIAVFNLYQASFHYGMTTDAISNHVRKIAKPIGEILFCGRVIDVYDLDGAFYVKCHKNAEIVVTFASHAIIEIHRDGKYSYIEAVKYTDIHNNSLFRLVADLIENKRVDTTSILNNKNNHGDAKGAKRSDAAQSQNDNTSSVAQNAATPLQNDKNIIRYLLTIKRVTPTQTIEVKMYWNMADRALYAEYASAIAVLQSAGVAIHVPVITAALDDAPTYIMPMKTFKRLLNDPTFDDQLIAALAEEINVLNDLI